MTTNDALLFHEKCGTLIKLSNNNKTAERRRPLDEFNNGVVMTNRPLRHNEMFEVSNHTIATLSIACLIADLTRYVYIACQRKVTNTPITRFVFHF